MISLRLCSTLVLLLLAGCAASPLYRTSPVQDLGVHPLVEPYRWRVGDGGLFHLSCTDKRLDGRSMYEAFDADRGTPATRAELASRHFVHAAMASNVYRQPYEKPLFVLPRWHLLERQESTSGMSLDVHGDAPTVQASRNLVVSYRGTDFESLQDWKANLALTEPAQFAQAYRHLVDLKRQNRDAHVVVTGHSLGGAIALNMSMRVEGVEAVAFNASPRAFFGATRPLPNARTHLYEVGEILNAAFGVYLRLRLPAGTIYGNYNFMDYRFYTFSPVPEHGIYELARALTLVAMMRGNQAARELFVANVPMKQAREVDWDNCAALYAGQ